MKRLLVIATTIFTIVACNSDRQTHFVFNEEECTLIITDNTTKTELQDISDFLINEKNVEFDFSKSTFKDDGKVDEVNIFVDFGDGFSGNANGNNHSLRTIDFGFSRKLNSEGKEVFAIGKL
jgi:hypothetical protein